MNILIDIGHPAHVHLFKNYAKEMINHGHKVLFTCRDKEFEIYLLEFYGFEYKSFGKKYKSTAGKLLGMIKFDIKEFLTGLKFKPDILLSHGSIYAAHASFLLGKPHIAFEDTFNFEQIKLYKPFTETILTGMYDHPLKGKKIIRFKGYHELAYLHPNHFNPDISVLKELDVNEGEKYVILRFVSWNASHDRGHSGISHENKLKLIEEFSKHGKIFISSEKQLPENLEPYRIKIAPERMHHAIYFSSLLFGESSTMSEEAAMLGIPSVYLFNNSTIYTKHLEEQYGLIFNYSESDEDQLKAIQKGIEILSGNYELNYWKSKADQIIEDHVDVTSFIIWFTKNYPESKKTMLNDPDYQLKFQ